MNVLMPQCGTVGVNSTVIRSEYFGSKVICGAETTASCSSVMLRCSGSEIDRMSSMRVVVSCKAMDVRVVRGRAEYLVLVDGFRVV